MRVGERWEDCPPGLISAMVARRRRARLKRAALAAAPVAAVLVLVGTFLSARYADVAVEPISCARAVELFADYRESLLSTTLARQVRVHLRDCPHCRERFDDQFAPEAHSPAPHADGLVMARSG